MGDAITVLGCSDQRGRYAVCSLRAEGAQALGISRRTGTVPQQKSTRHLTLSAYGADESTRALSRVRSVIVMLGMPYRARVWEEQWPKLIGAVLTAAARVGRAVTMLDNTDVYGRSGSPLTEQAPLPPRSEKGRARLAGWRLVAQAQADGQDVLIGRAADVLGEASIRQSCRGRCCAQSSRVLGNRFGGSATPQSDIRLLLPKIRQTRCRGERGDYPVLHLPVLPPVNGWEFAEALAASLNAECVCARCVRGKSRCWRL
ncbi:NAD-dependent epimerase/dehydratase family protein [Leucobacter luti]|uniref:NAD-dependent epimerase/dehydratase family protein n=1 Tax=Leucobacter luti TaxID=340320 RepID=UPI003D06FDE0